MALKIELDVNGLGEWTELDFVDSAFPVALEKSSVDLTNLSKRAGEFTYTIEIPRTPMNDKAFKFVGEPSAPNKFNKNSNYRMRIFSNGLQITIGNFKLQSISSKSIKGNLIGDSIAWFEQLAGKTIRDLDLGELSFTGDQSIIDYYSGRTDIAWPLVAWAGFENRVSQDYYVYGSHKTSPRYTYRNFKPAVFVKHIFLQAMAEAGISISGEFVESEEFNKMIILFGGDETYLPWKNLTDAQWRMSSASINVNIDENASNQIFSVAKYTDTWSNTSRVSNIQKAVTTLPNTATIGHKYILYQSILLDGGGINQYLINSKVYLYTINGWVDITSEYTARVGMTSGTFGYIYDLSNLPSISNPTPNYIECYPSTNTSTDFRDFRRIGITDFNILPENNRPSIFTAIRGGVTKYAFQTVLNDDGDNINKVKQGTFDLNGTTLTASDNYSARDFKLGDYLVTDIGNRFTIANTNDSVLGPWTVVNFNGTDFSDQTIYRHRDAYDIPVEGRYDVALGYGQFSAAYNTGIDINNNPIKSYFAGSDYYGNTWLLLNAHAIMAIKNYSVNPSFAIDEARKYILRYSSGNTFDLSTTQLSDQDSSAAQAVLAMSVRYGQSNTLINEFWTNDWELVPGDDVSIVHVTFCGGSLIVGGWENSFVGTNSGNDSFDTMGIRLTEETETKVESINGISTTTTFKPQILNNISGEYEEGYDMFRINKILPNISIQDFVRTIMNIFNLYFVWDNSTRSLSVIPFNNYYLDNNFVLEIDDIVQNDSEDIEPLNGIPGVKLTYNDDATDEFQHLYGSTGAIGELKGTIDTIYLDETKAEIKLPFSNTAGAGFVFWPGLETYGVNSAMYTQDYSAVRQDVFNNFYGYQARIVNLTDFQDLTNEQSFGIDRPYIYINAVRYPVKQGIFNGSLLAENILNTNYNSVYNLFGAREKWDIDIYCDEVTWNKLKLNTPIRYKGQIFLPIKIGPWLPGKKQLTKITMIKR